MTDTQAAVKHKPYHARFISHTIPAILKPGELIAAVIEIQNVGHLTWEVAPPDGMPVNLFLQHDEGITTFELPRAVSPNDIIKVPVSFIVPATGPAQVSIDLVKQNFAIFSDLGSDPLILSTTSTIEGARPLGLHASKISRYGIKYLDHRCQVSVAPKSRFGVWVRMQNIGSMTWELNSLHGRHVTAAILIDGKIAGEAALPTTVKPLEEVDVHIVVAAPSASGQYELQVTLAHQGFEFFSTNGVPALLRNLEVKRAAPQQGAQLYEVALLRNSAFYHPGGGVSQFADGTHVPQVLEGGKGCNIWDTNGRKYIDYTMGWGCALLGHGHKKIEKAVISSMSCGPVLPLPHRIELELTEDLCQRSEIPCAEAVAFGKNGSDVCTLAARLARVSTGRKTILTCGYHGWQDWYAEGLGFEGTGVPERTPQLVSSFLYNDIESFRSALSSHRSDLAAVILEPSGAAGGPEGVGGAVDAAFLKDVAQETRAAGALLIFDEIITGFRHLGGSVQKATNIVPDLACFGKALGNGFPISALVGRRDIMLQMSRAFYGPTFKGEVYSLAAARAALAIYRSEPVWEHVSDFGERLKNGILQICQTLSFKARVAGPTFRMSLVFEEPDVSRRRLLRTLYLQELLRGGLVTYSGVMLPSYAHGDAELKITLDKIERAISVCHSASSRDVIDLHRLIEMPLV